MTPTLTTNDTKNYCNRTLIVKVVVDSHMFLWDTVYIIGVTKFRCDHC